MNAAIGARISATTRFRKLCPSIAVVCGRVDHNDGRRAGGPHGAKTPGRSVQDSGCSRIEVSGGRNAALLGVICCKNGIVSTCLGLARGGWVLGCCGGIVGENLSVSNGDLLRVFCYIAAINDPQSRKRAYKYGKENYGICGSG